MRCCLRETAMPTTLLIVYRVLGTVLFALAAAAIVEKYRTVRGAALLPLMKTNNCLLTDFSIISRHSEVKMAMYMVRHLITV